MTKQYHPPVQPQSERAREFKLEPNVHFDGVPWFRDEGVFVGESLVSRIATVRLFAPDAALRPRFIDVPSYWVRPVYQ